jgi:MFS family permease
MIAGVLVLAIGFTRVFAMTALMLLLDSYFYVIFMASVNTTMQMNATNEFRGRVMSVYTLVVAGSTPLGNLFAGGFAEGFSARAGFIACGVAIVILLAPLYLFLRKEHKKLSDKPT